MNKTDSYWDDGNGNKYDNLIIVFQSIGVVAQFINVDTGVVYCKRCLFCK